MPSFDEALPLILMSAADPDGSPGDGFVGLEPFGAMIAALLARQVGPAVWRPVIDAMAEQGLLHPSRLDDAGIPEIQDALRGKARSISARTLAPAKQLARWLVENYEGQVGAFAESGRSTDDLREKLARVRGVGMVGADALLLAALRRPAFPVDRGTYRVLLRHGWLDTTAAYDDAREFVIRHAGEDPDALIGLADGMESLAARYCLVSAPRCDACPLRPLLPEGGPLAVDE
jgi:endonuclease-3 related protein